MYTSNMRSLPRSGVGQAVRVADQALAGAVSDPCGVAGLSHEELTDLVSTLGRVQARADALLLAAVGEVDARGSYSLDGAITAGSWVRAVAHHTPGQAARTVRTARTLRSGLLPNTSAALAAGELTGAHAAVIANAMTGAPAGAVALIEPEAVAAAVGGDVRATAEVMRRFQTALDPDAVDEAAMRRYDRAGFTLSPTLGGTSVFSGTADESTAAVIAAAVHAAGPPVRGDARTPARRRLDALADICRHWLDRADQDGAAPRRTGRQRTQLIVTIDPDGLRTPTPASGSGDGGCGARSAGGTLSWVGPITAATAARLGCDSLATFVTLSPDGEIVEAGTERRFFTNSQIRAVVARDGDRCCAPFCDRPVAWSDGHHLIARADGGPTTVLNGALPCEAHHLMLHEGHWKLERLPDGRYRLHHPRTGKTLGPEPPHPAHSRPPAE
jgi:hypothetical protein